MTIQELPFGTKVEGKKNGVFVAMTLKSKIYENYGDPTVDPQQVVTLLVMCHRWDGMQGLIGGFLDGDESFEDCAIREAYEEVNISLTREQLKPLCTHDIGWVVVHAYHVDLGEMSDGEVKRLARQMTAAQHVVVEATPILAHLKDYGRGKGLQKLLQSNTLAPAVKEELEALCAKLGIQ